MTTDLYYAIESPGAYHCRIDLSVPVNVLTALAALSYADKNASEGKNGPTPWAEDKVKELPERSLKCLRVTRPIFAHGIILKDKILVEEPLSEPMHASWAAFREFLGSRDRDWWRHAVGFGVMGGLRYYTKNFQPIDHVEAYLKRQGGVPDIPTVTATDKTLREGIHMLLATWSTGPDDPAAALALDSDRVADEMLALIEDIWQTAFEPEWNQNHGMLELLVGDKGNILARDMPWDPAILVPWITGLRPDERLVNLLRSARTIIFLPCLQLRRRFVLRLIDETAFLLYRPDLQNVAFAVPEVMQALQPAGGKLSTQRMAAMCNALGEPRRMQLVQLLAEGGELYGQEIVTALRANQSTVSRDLGKLEEVGLVNSRSEGTQRYFSLAAGDLQRLSRGLAGLADQD